VDQGLRTPRRQQEGAEISQIVVNVLMVAAILWWIWMVTDAFDFVDIAQHFRYHSFREEVETVRRCSQSQRWNTHPAFLDWRG
jgi:hypothetical protein